jgi:putative spermidine/putrescine transport system permease protein
MKDSFDLGALAVRISGGVILAFLAAPILVTVIVSFNHAGFNLPPDRFTLHWYETALATPEFTRGMLVSFVLALVAAGSANVIGLPVALALTRFDFPGKSTLNLFVMSPLLIPATILGLALYVFVIRIGLGSGLVPLSVGHTVLVLPFAVRVLTASLQIYDRSLEEAALNVGASPLRTMLSITLPIIRAGLFASMMMCFIISWNDFALSIFLASSNWVPLPVQIFQYIKFQYDAVSAAVVTTVIFLSAVLIVLLDRVIGLQTIMGTSRR